MWVRRVAVVVLVLAGAVLAGAAPPRPLPPLSWTCPMHPEVVTDSSGKCPICSMTLVPVRLDSVWSCQLHPDVTKLDPGRCPIDGRTLVRMIKALSFTCPGNSKINEVNPGKCPDGRPMVAKYSLRPHGDHNPKHGGLFFMAPNNWHVEVTHPVPGLFKLYVYDDYTRPFLPPGFSARIVTVTSASGTDAHASIPFTHAPGNNVNKVLEAHIPGLGLPATLTVKVRFQANDQEYQFDFPFPDFSKEPK